MGYGHQQCHICQPKSQIVDTHCNCIFNRGAVSALFVLLVLISAATECSAQPAQPLCSWSDGICSLNFTVFATSSPSSNSQLQQQLAKLQQKTWHCIATGSVTQPGNAVWQQACAADQAEQCTTLQAAEGGPTFCIARGLPESLGKLLLGPNSCAVAGGSGTKSQQEWTATYVASAVWWQTGCATVNASDVARVLAAENASWSAGQKYDETTLLEALIELDSSSKWCTSRASPEACSAADLLPYMPAFNTSCGVEMLHQLDNCCMDKERVDFSSQGLSGWLPERFMPASLFTDLSNNPALCGTLALTRSTASAAGSMLPAPFNLHNSNVKVDLSDMSAYSGPMVARWLGDGALAFNNLYGKLSLEGSYLMCVFMRTGKLSVAKSGACKPAASSSCTCKGSLAVLLHGSSEDWAACHRDVTNVSFDSTPHQAKALAQYDRYMLGFEPAFACGAGGRAYRNKITAVVWCVTPVVIGVLVAVAIVYRERLRKWLYEEDQLPNATAAAAAASASRHWLVQLAEYVVDVFSSQRQQQQQNAAAQGVQPPAGSSSSSITHRRKHKWWAKALYLASYVGLHSADVLLDWVYVYNVARAGNLHVLLWLGWLLLAPYVLVQLVYAVCLLRFKENASGTLRQQWREHSWRPAIAALFFIEATLAVSLPAAATSRLLQYAGSSSYISQADCIFMAWIFVSCAVFSQLVLFFIGLLWKARSHLANNNAPWHIASSEARDACDRRARAIDSLAPLGDLLFLLLEDVPQLIVQTWFWVSGMALLPAWLYGLSTALSLLGLGFGLGHVLLRVLGHGGVVKWAADVAAAWRLQLIVVPGSNSSA